MSRGFQAAALSQGEGRRVVDLAARRGRDSPGKAVRILVTAPLFTFQRARSPCPPGPQRPAERQRAANSTRRRQAVKTIPKKFFRPVRPDLSPAAR